MPNQVTSVAAAECHEALRLSRLGRPVKVMIGGVTGWLDEGFPLLAGAGGG